ncbi:MAG: ATPase, T2SS/T4P/T4SS family [Nitrososphaeria archaeon]
MRLKFLDFRENRPKPTFREKSLFVELFSEVYIDLPKMESYPLGMFEVSLRSLRGRNLYCVSCAEEFKVLLKKTKHILDEISDDPHLLDFREISFDFLTRHLSSLIQSRLVDSGLREEDRVGLSSVLAFEYMKISRILPLMLDPHVQEFYVDSPETCVYLDHDLWGRCLTNVQLTLEEVRALTTHMQTFSGYALDYSVNSLKTDWRIKEYVCRLSLDTSPLSATGFNLDVRKISSKVHTMPELVRSGALTKDVVLYLLFFLSLGRNVTIIGESNSGKTTLLNALDLLLPPDKRRIYVEDVVESIDLLRYNYHQAKYRVSPYDIGAQRGSKSVEVTKILHRSPNIIILGEIQTREHSEALFSSLSSGIRGMQTFHATSIEQAFRRWIFSHGIDPVNLNELDLIVQMNKTSTFPIRRYVASVSEVSQSGFPKLYGEGATFSFNEIFARDLGGEMVCLCPLEKTLTFKKLNTIYRDIFLRAYFEIMSKLFASILEADVSFDSLVEGVSDVWCRVNESICL